GFFVNTEMLTRARQLDLDVVEVPVRHRARTKGASKVTLADIPRTLAALLPFWWTRVLFVGTSTECATQKNERNPQSVWHSPFFQLATLLLVAGVLFCTRLSCPLLEPEETRSAEIPRQMLLEGRFAEPVWHGEPYFHKPPLLYWLVMASYSLFGIHD